MSDIGCHEPGRIRDSIPERIRRLHRSCADADLKEVVTVVSGDLAPFARLPAQPTLAGAVRLAIAVCLPRSGWQSNDGPVKNSSTQYVPQDLLGHQDSSGDTSRPAATRAPCRVIVLKPLKRSRRRTRASTSDFAARTMRAALVRISLPRTTPHPVSSWKTCSRRGDSRLEEIAT